MTWMLPAAVLVTEAASSSDLSFTLLYIFFNKYLFVYLAMLGLSCIMQDLLLQCTNSLGCDAQTQ